MRPQTTHCAGLLTSEGGTPMPRIGLLLSCVPVGWRVSLLKRLGGCRSRPWQRSTWGGASGYDALGGYSIDLVESGLIIMFHSEIISLALSLFISGVSPTWPLRFSRTTRWGVASDSGSLEGGSTWDEHTGQILSGVLFAFEPYLTTVFNRGQYLSLLLIVG